VKDFVSIWTDIMHVAGGMAAAAGDPSFVRMTRAIMPVAGGSAAAAGDSFVPQDRLFVRQDDRGGLGCCMTFSA
jgi:hypothetical protein